MLFLRATSSLHAVQNRTVFSLIHTSFWSGNSFNRCSGITRFGSLEQQGAFRRFPSWGRFRATFLFLFALEGGACFNRESRDETTEPSPALAPELGPGSGDDIESERPSCSDIAYRRSSCRITAIALFA